MDLNDVNRQWRLLKNMNFDDYNIETMAFWKTIKDNKKEMIVSYSFC